MLAIPFRYIYFKYTTSLGLRTLCESPETLTKQKSENVTDNQPNHRVGARDAYTSKNSYLLRAAEGLENSILDLRKGFLQFSLFGAERIFWKKSKISLFFLPKASKNDVVCN